MNLFLQEIFFSVVVFWVFFFFCGRLCFKDDTFWDQNLILKIEKNRQILDV